MKRYLVTRMIMYVGKASLSHLPKMVLHTSKNVSSDWTTELCLGFSLLRELLYFLRNPKKAMKADMK